MTMLSFLSIGRQTEGAEMVDGAAGTSWRWMIYPKQALIVYKIKEGFRVLQKYWLVQWKPDQQSYAMHKLVHAWGCDRLAEEDQCKFIEATFGLVVEAVESCSSAHRQLLHLF